MAEARDQPGPAHGQNCMMCWEAGADLVFQPCGHQVMCRECSEPFVRNQVACPKCSMQILSGYCLDL